MNTIIVYEKTGGKYVDNKLFVLFTDHYSYI
jgi:hypothetical protein